MAKAFDSMPCPVCAVHQVQPTRTEDFAYVRIACPNCGTHRFREGNIDDLPSVLSKPEDRAKVAHGVQQRPTDDIVTAEEIAQMVKTIKLPEAATRVDRLLQHLAKSEPGTTFTLTPKYLRAYLGCLTAESAKWVIDQAKADGLISMNNATGGEELTTRGWHRHTELMRKGAGSRLAFMAMAFGDENLWQVFREHMQPAVKATGFDLITTVDGQKAGCIISRMKVEIHTSRFLVCDLSHGNHGAYWEAGFAEGIGRPVIYTCRSDVLTDKTRHEHPHFDTAQQLIIKWDAAGPSRGMQELKDVIRATLPAEATMQDP